MNIFRKTKAWLRLYSAVVKADRAHKATGERYYVMPLTGSKGKLIIMDRYNFRKLKLKRYVGNKTFINDLERECFYCTPYRNGKGKLPGKVIAIKKRQYFSWVASVFKRRGK